MPRRFWITVLLGAVLWLAAIRAASGLPQSSGPDLGALSDDDRKTLTLRLERIGCYGTCPAYTVTVHGNGQVEYAGNSHVKETGTRHAQVEIATVRNLMSEFAKAKFFPIAEDYSGGKCTRYCTDMGTAVTELGVKGTTHRVNHYYGCGGVPKSLFDLESAIDKSADSERWTGDTGRQRPFATTCM
jgi:hypothetical protein